MFWKALAFSFVVAVSALAQNAKHPFTFEDMMKLKRVDEPVPSPDGKWVVFSATDVDLEANTKISHLWIVPASGGESKRLSETPNHEERPRFSPDGKRLIWTSKATDPTQIWMSDFDTANGALVGKTLQLTTISTGADGGIWSPDGKNIVFVSAVYPDCADDACNKQRDEEIKKSKVKAKILTRLFYRHWNAFTEFKRSHLFVASADSSVEAAVSAPRDLTLGDHDVPPFHLGGQDMYAISPDGQELAYTSNIDNGQSGSGLEATSTNSEIFTVPLVASSANGQSGPPNGRTRPVASSDPKKISTSPGADTTPLYSSDGKYIAWRSQARAGFEADKWNLVVCERETGRTITATEKFEYSVGSFVWETVGGLLFSFERHGEEPIGMASAFVAGSGVIRDGDGAKWANVTKGGIHDSSHADDLVMQSATKDHFLYFTKSSIAGPSEIWRINCGSDLAILSEGKEVPRPVTHMNDALLSQIDMQPLESFTFKGANDEEVQGFMVKPPGFDPNKKYPLKFLIHGGPQGRGEIRGRIAGTRSCSLRPKITWW